MSRLLYAIIFPIIYVISLLPLKAHYAISSFISFCIKNILHYRSNVIYTNLSRAFPDLKYPGLKETADEFYLYMTDVMAESVWAYKASAKKLTSVVSVKNPELLSDIVNRHGNAIVVMGHQGNWELISALSGDPDSRPSWHYGNADFVIAYKKLENELSDRIFHKIRMAGYRKFRATGTIVESNDLFRYMIKNRDRKSVYFMIADQSSPKPKLITQFLNQQTAVFIGPEHISRKLGIPVVYMNNDRISRGKYEVTYSVITENPSSEPQGKISSDFMKMLEEGINRNRASWLWSHKRWKKKFNPEDQRLTFI